MRRELHRRLATAIREERGNVALIVALAARLPGWAGALAVETSFDYAQQTRLQAAADAAAYAGSLDNAAGLPTAQISADAAAAAQSNGWTGKPTDIQVNSPPTSGADLTADAVEVILQQPLPRFFTAYFSSTPLLAKARAVAIYRSAGNACILALDKTASASVDVQGNTTVDLVGCDVMANSISNSAIYVQGSAQIATDCLISAGGVSVNSGLTMTGCTSAVTNAPRARDPFSGLPVPPTGSKQSVPNGQNVTLNPGYYPNGMSLKNTVTLNPGTYYVSGGSFNVNAQANVSGSGVTIFLAAGTTVSMNGNSHVALSAPTSGTYSGILFFGDPSATGGSNTFNGDGTSSLTGDLYFPTEAVDYKGNFTGVNGCTQVVADTVQWTGNSNISVNCASAGMTPIPAQQAVKITQ